LGLELKRKICIGATFQVELFDYKKTNPNTIIYQKNLQFSQFFKTLNHEKHFVINDVLYLECAINKIILPIVYTPIPFILWHFNIFNNQ